MKNSTLPSRCWSFVLGGEVHPLGVRLIDSTDTRIKGVREVVLIAD